MATSNKLTVKKIVKVVSIVSSSDLALREWANKLFDHIEAQKAKAVTVDFSEVSSITRSFAHQYQLRKSKTKKRAREINKPLHVEKMFALVNRQSSMKITPPPLDALRYLPDPCRLEQ